VPLLASAMSYLLCDLACHLDVEGDHDLFVGQITRGKLNRKADPKVHIRKTGMRY
jgi:flavin reductase (DIM6/NTAB) family NADH-FMN oxidoreductase RutF